MDDKEEAKQEFFKSFKIALNLASIYFHEHPLFIKSVDNLKDKIVTLSNFINPIKLGFTTNSLSIEGKYWDKERLHIELAYYFHLRKIKSLNIKKGVTTDELVFFLNKVSLSPRDLMRGGGMGSVLTEKGISNINVEELDYSQLLKGEGEASQDIWGYLLGDALSKDDSDKIKGFTDNFEQVMGQFKIKELVENDSLRETILKFLNYLKEKEEERFKQCVRFLMKSVLKDKNIPSKEGLDTLKTIFDNLGVVDFAQTLWDEIVTDDNFDVVSFNLFGKLMDRDKHDKVSSALSNIINRDMSISANPYLKEKVKDLFSNTSNASVFEIYRRTFSSLLESSFMKEGISSQRDLLHRNYRFILLSLAAVEKNIEKLSFILEKFLNAWDEILKDMDLKCLRCLLDVLAKLRSLEPLKHIIQDIDKRMSDFVENKVLEGETFSYFEYSVGPIDEENLDMSMSGAASSDFEYLIDLLRERSVDVNIYFKTIFEQNKINPHIIRLFFKFFSVDLTSFYQNIKKKVNDVKFIEEMINNLEAVDSTLTIESLKYIFSVSNNFIKIEILKIMKNLTSIDERFLLSILKKGEIFLRREALDVFKRDEKSLKRAMEALLCFSNPLGINNDRLEENLNFIKEKKIRDIKEYLIPLTKKNFFWNRNIRIKAKEVLSFLEHSSDI